MISILKIYHRIYERKILGFLDREQRPAFIFNAVGKLFFLNGFKKKSDWKKSTYVVYSTKYTQIIKQQEFLRILEIL